MKIDVLLSVIFAIASFICSWIYRGYLYGKKEQSLENKVESLEKETYRIGKEVKENQEKIMDIFYDSDTKTSRFLTNSDCGKNTKLVLLHIKTLTETVNKLNINVEDLTKNLTNVEKTIAIIESMRKEGGLRYYDLPKRITN